MTVKELLSKADLYKIAETEAEAETEWLRICDKEKNIHLFVDRFTKRAYRSFQKMLLIDETVHPDKIIVVISDNGEFAKCYASLYNKEEIIKKELPYEIKEDQLMFKEWNKDNYFYAYTFVFDSWSDVLGYEVANESVDKYGYDNVAKAILREMTMFGFEQSESDEKRAQELSILEKRLGKSDTKNKPIEVNIDDLYELFGFTKPTEEEKEQRRIAASTACLKEKREEFLIINKLKHRLRKEKQNG